MAIVLKNFQCISSKLLHLKQTLCFFCIAGCPEGFYGDNCSETCQCHSNDECDFVSGNCTCEPGYTGPTCHTPCESGYYGENCTSLCSCEVNGTAECDNVNGTCYCLDMWLGDDCEVPPCELFGYVPYIIIIIYNT